MKEPVTAKKPRVAGAALVSGAGGLLGRAVSKRLSDSGWQVVSRSHSQLDISNSNQVALVFDEIAPDLVINCAATADVDRCETELDWAVAVNETGPRLLARAANRIGAEIVHVSTDYVFDGSKPGFYTQEDTPHPLGVYGRTKLDGELAVKEENARSYVVRTSWLFGTGGKNFGSRVIELTRKGVRLKGVVDQTSIPTYAPDLAARIEQIVQLGSYGLYQVTSSGPATWMEFARAALELAGLGETEIEPVKRSDLKQAARRPANSAMRCLLSEKLGLAPLRHWREALVDFVKEQS